MFWQVSAALEAMTCGEVHGWWDTDVVNNQIYKRINSIDYFIQNFIGSS